MNSSNAVLDLVLGGLFVMLWLAVKGMALLVAFVVGYSCIGRALLWALAW